MSPEDELLIACTRQEFSLEYRLEVSRLASSQELGWDDIVSTAMEQGVSPLLHMNLAQCSAAGIPVPAGVMACLQLSEVNAVALHGARVAQLGQLLSFLNSHAINAMLIKGAALEIRIYDRPWVTTANDIDLILDIEEETFTGADKEQFDKLSRGYSLEYDFVEHHDVTMNDILPVDFQRVWADASTVDYHGRPCFVMCAEDMLISLCINSCRRRYFRLKSLFDIAETVGRCPDLDWQLMAARARAYRCNDIVYTALLATQATLGCRLPDTVGEDLAVSRARARIIRSTIDRRVSQPLFGSKNSKRVLGRGIDLSLALPYLSYRGDQVVKRAWYVWRTRKRPMGLLDVDEAEA